jgi:hypothetical protein
MAESLMGVSLSGIRPDETGVFSGRIRIHDLWNSIAGPHIEPIATILSDWS